MFRSWRQQPQSTERRKGLIARFWRSSRGAAAVEFSMIAPAFFMILFPMFEIGITFTADAVLQNAVNDAARKIRLSKCFDNATSCSSENAVVLLDAIYEPAMKALEAEGTTFTNYVVSDSLCCPSRTTIFRGQYVHNHHVVSNDQASGGGWPVFRDQGYPKDCLPVWLHKAGVRTGLVGKYLNQFPQRRGDPGLGRPVRCWPVPFVHHPDPRRCCAAGPGWGAARPRCRRRGRRDGDG